MGYTAPTTRATDDLVTASIWNTDLVNNISFLANPPACRVFHNTTQAVATATNTTLVFNSERFDTDTMHSTAALTSRITFNTAGIYVVTGNIEWAASPGTNHGIWVLLNGTTMITRFDSVTANGRLAVSTVYKFAAADYVELVVVQNTGGSINIASTGNYSPEFAAAWVGLG